MHPIVTSGHPIQELNSQFTWINWASVLDIFPDGPTLPATATCPRCLGTATIRHDLFYNVPWWHCTGCLLQGDLATITRAILPSCELTDECRHEAIRLATEISVTQQEAPNVIQPGVCELIAAAMSRFPTLTTESASCLRESLGFFDPMCSQDRWLAGAGRFVGMVNRHDLEHQLRPLSRRSEDFSGPGWEDLAIFPAWDLPGRICGLGCLGREGKDPQDLRYRHLLAGSRGGRYQRHEDMARVEAGLFMLPAVLGPPHPEFGDTVFAIGSVVAAARLHIRHLLDNVTVLPIVAWWASNRHATYQTWDLLTGRPICFWSPRNDADTLRQARRCEGRVIVHEAGESRQRLLQGHPVQLLRWVARSAVPWQVALEKELTTLPAYQARHLLDGLDLPVWEAEELAGTFGGVARQRMLSRREAAPKSTWKSRTGRSIYMRPDGWYAGKARPKQLTDFTFTIDEELICPRRNTVYYRGKFIRRGRTETYTVNTDRWQCSGPLPYFREFALRRNLGVPSILHRSDFGLERLSRLFRQPRRRIVCDAIGWDAELQSFVFPEFRIAANGQPLLCEVPLTELDPIAPCRNLGRRWSLHTTEIDWLSREHGETPLLWAVALLVLHHAIGPVFQQPPARYAVLGCNGEIAAAIAADLGCMPVAAGTYYVHNWLRIAQSSTVATIPSGSLARLGIADATTSAVAGGWNVLLGGTLPTPLLPQERPSDLPALISSCLVGLAQRRFQLEPGITFPAKLVATVATWFGEIGGNAEIPRNAAETHCRWDVPGSDWKAGLLAAGTVAAQPEALVVVKSRALLRCKAVNQLFASRGLPVPETTETCELFARADPTVGLRHHGSGRNHELCWSLTLAWLHDQLRRFAVLVPDSGVT